MHTGLGGPAIRGTGLRIQVPGALGACALPSPGPFATYYVYRWHRHPRDDTIIVDSRSRGGDNLL